MKFGFQLGYWPSSGPPEDLDSTIGSIERLCLDSMWTAETYGSDCLTPLAWLGARTSDTRLGTNIMQMAARTPAATAMAAMTLDHLSGGRFVLGLGASGPQVVEGWYGQPYPRPLQRTREYVAIVRAILGRAEPVTFQGSFYSLPAADGSGLGKSLKAALRPRRSHLPIFLAAQGPRNIALAAEIADGWLSLFHSPAMRDAYLSALHRGLERRSHSLSAQFEVAALVPYAVAEDVEQAADQIRPAIALYVGGMGAPGANFHYDAFVRLGYRHECDEIQRCFRGGDRDGAARAVSTKMVEEVALVGPLSKIRDELPKWENSLVDTMILQGDPAALPDIVQLREDLSVSGS